jgi:IS4 transposase
MSLEMLEDGDFPLGTGTNQVKVKVTAFCDLESRKEFRLANNLPATGVNEFSNTDISDMYRQKWQMKLLWKFLKMRLNLDQLITKNVSGIMIQIYANLTAYVILRLVEMPKEYSSKVLDELSYLQAFMNENISYVHWFEKMVLTG